MITLVVQPDEGTEYEITATSRDVVRWEKTHKGARLANLENASMGDLYALAYCAAVRLKKFAGTEEDFLNTVDIATREDEEATPTKRGR